MPGQAVLNAPISNRNCSLANKGPTSIFPFLLYDPNPLQPFPNLKTLLPI